MLPAVLKVPVLIEACAGRREENDIARLGVVARVRDGVLHVGGRHDRCGTFERRGNALSGGTDRQYSACLFADEVTHPLELAGLVFAAQDQPDARRREGLE